MKLKSLKGKLLIGVIVVGLFSSVGIALANTGAGEALKDWYDGMFTESVDAAKEESQEYGEQVFEDLLKEYEEIKAEAAAAIDETRASETANGEEKISDAKQERIDELLAAKAEIEGEMGIDFYDEFAAAILELENLTAEAEKEAETDLKEHTGDEGEAALAQLTADLEAAEEAAVSDLEEAVENVKAELTEELNNRSANLTQNLNTWIDGNADDLREAVEEIKSDLVEKQETLIADAAEELTDDAIDSLDDVVSGINE